MESPSQGAPPVARQSTGAAAPSPAAQQQQQPPPPGRSAPPAFSAKLEQRWGRGEVAMEAAEPLPAEEEEFVEPSPQKPAKGGTFLNRIPADLLPFYKQLVPYYPYYSDYVPEDMVHVYRKLLPYFESTSNWKTSGLSSYWKGKEKRSIKMKDDYEALKRRDQEEDILLKIGQKMRELKMKQIEDNIQSQEILVEGLKKKYASMWKDEEGMEKKLDMGMKLAVETEPGKPNEEDPFAKVPTSMATYRNFEDVMDEKFRRLMGDFGELTVERRRLAWGGKKLKSGDEQEGMAGKGGFIGYSSGYRYRTRRAPRHGTIGYNVDSYYDVYVDDYFDEDMEPAPEPEPAAPSAAPVEQPVDPNLFAQDFIDGVPAVVDPVTTFKEEEFKHLEWDKDVAVVEDTYVEPEPPTEPVPAPELTAEQGLYVTVGADGSLVSADGAVFAVLANGCLKGADGAVFAPTGVILAVDNTLANAGIAFEGSIALADGVKLEEGRKFVIKQQQLAEGETLLSFLGGAEFVDGAGRLFRRAADGTFLGADLDNLEAWTYSGCALTAKDSTKLEGEMLQGASEWKWVVSGVELERGAKIAVKPKNKADGDVLLLKSDGSLVDGAGGVYSISPEGLLVGPEGVIFGATGQYLTPAGVAQNANVTFADGAVLANGNGVSAGSKIVAPQIGRRLFDCQLSRQISRWRRQRVFRSSRRRPHGPRWRCCRRHGRCYHSGGNVRERGAVVWRRRRHGQWQESRHWGQNPR